MSNGKSWEALHKVNLIVQKSYLDKFSNPQSSYSKRINFFYFLKVSTTVSYIKFFFPQSTKLMNPFVRVGVAFNVNHWKFGIRVVSSEARALALLFDPLPTVQAFLSTAMQAKLKLVLRQHFDLVLWINFTTGYVGYTFYGSRSFELVEKIEMSSSLWRQKELKTECVPLKLMSTIFRKTLRRNV